MSNILSPLFSNCTQMFLFEMRMTLEKNISNTEYVWSCVTGALIFWVIRLMCIFIPSVIELPLKAKSGEKIEPATSGSHIQVHWYLSCMLLYFVLPCSFVSQWRLKIRLKCKIRKVYLVSISKAFWSCGWSRGKVQHLW